MGKITIKESSVFIWKTKIDITQEVSNNAQEFQVTKYTQIGQNSPKLRHFDAINPENTFSYVLFVFNYFSN